MIPVILVEIILGGLAIFTIVSQMLQINELKAEIVRLRNGNEQVNTIKRQLDDADKVRQSIGKMNGNVA